jgi:pantoate--beta-alanine ligase
VGERIRTVRTVAELRAAVAAWRRAGETVALVPTMGALHRGHVSLVEAARAACRRCITTLFVNPKQFGPREDFSHYPRQEAADRALLDAVGCDLLFAPGVGEMYPAGFSTTVWLQGVTDRWEGEARPGHFAGVATVVTKLLLQAMADKAFFGEKDYQQLQAVKRMVRDLDIPVEIVGCPTVRDPDGLALSSRNAHLSAAERRIAPLLHRTIADLAAAAAEGGNIAAAITAGKAALLAAGFSAVDYLALVDATTLEPLDRLDRAARVLAAARLGAVRLIDNVAATPRTRP